MRSKADMHAAQQRVATYLYENDSVQAVMGMGGGKTAAAMTAIRELIDDGHIRCALVIAPKRVAQLVWTKEHLLWEHLETLCIAHVSGGPTKRAKAFQRDADVYVVGIDNAQWLAEQLAGLPEGHKFFDLLIIDESSRLKNPRGKRRKALQKLSRRWKIKWGLTGTPRPNGYEDQFGPLNFLTGAKLWGASFDKWRERYFMPTDWNGYNWVVRPEWEKKLLEDINSVTITIPPEDMPDLPEMNTVVHWVDLPAAAMKEYKRMERHLLAQVNDRNIAAMMQATATGKLAQMANGYVYGEGGAGDVEFLHNEKADLLAEMVEDLNGDPVLIAYEFREDLKIFAEQWPGVPYLGGGVADRRAEELEGMWNRRQLPILALHPASAGHGLNLQHGGSQMIWFGLTWSAELFDQTRKRYWRPGQLKRCFEHLILARGTIDEAKYDRVIGKMAAQDAFTKYLRRV